MRAFLKEILLNHNNAEHGLDSASTQLERPDTPRSYAVSSRGGESARGNRKGDEARDSSPASSPFTEHESAHGAQHGFLRDAAALAVHIHQEDDADDQDDQAGDTDDGSPHEGHGEDLCHNLRRRVE